MGTGSDRGMGSRGERQRECEECKELSMDDTQCVCEGGVNSKRQNKKFYQRMSLGDSELWQSTIKFAFLK